MDEHRFENSPVGRLVPITGFDPRFGEEYAHVAFVPDPLPAAPTFAPTTWASVADAMHALGGLDAASRQFPTPGLLVRPALSREAVSTSAIEGTFSDLEEVLAADPGDRLQGSLREVVNSIVAIEHGVESLRSGRALGVQLLCELQEIIIRGTPSEGQDTGRIRSGNVFIGSPNQRVPETRFVPCPAGPVLEGGVRELERWIADTTVEVAVPAKVALAHYQLETLHPFHDGNGRVGRTLTILQLISSGTLHYPNLSLSVWFERHDREYRDGLANVSETGDFDPWVSLVSQAMADQARNETQRIDRLLTLRSTFVSRARDARLRGLAVQISEDLIGYPVASVRNISDRYEVSFESANRAVKRLVEAGLVIQAGNQSYDRRFVAPEVMDALRSD